MNCNPFTKGHRYLIEQAANKVDHLYIFVVEEDKSVFPFADRFRLVKTGTEDLPNVTVLPSGKYILSAITFPEYFQKDALQEVVIDTSLDIEVFAKVIAPALHITKRFVGQEPFDMITRQYNQSMKEILPKHGIEVFEIERLSSEDKIISASYVRKLLEKADYSELSKFVPPFVLNYLENSPVTPN